MSEDNASMHHLHNVMTGTSWFDRTMGVAEGVLQSPLGHAAHETLHHSAPNLMPFLGAMMGPLGFLAGAGETVMGTQQAMHSGGMKQADGVIKALQGVGGMVSGGVTTASALGALPAVTGAGFLGTGVSGIAAAGPLAAAGAIGLGTGALINHHMQGNTVGGLFGKDDTGHQRDASDLGADAGISVERGFQNLLGVKEGGDGFFNTIGDVAGDVLGAGTAMAVGTGATLGGLGVEAGQAMSRFGGPLFMAPGLSPLAEMFAD